MARNPYFPVGHKMCLMGDIKVRVYYSLSGNVHLSDCGVRILVLISKFYIPRKKEKRKKTKKRKNEKVRLVFVLPFPTMTFHQNFNASPPRTQPFTSNKSLQQQEALQSSQERSLTGREFVFACVCCFRSKH